MVLKRVSSLRDSDLLFSYPGTAVPGYRLLRPAARDCAHVTPTHALFIRNSPNSIRAFREIRGQSRLSALICGESYPSISKLLAARNHAAAGGPCH